MSEYARPTPHPLGELSSPGNSMAGMFHYRASIMDGPWNFGVELRATLLSPVRALSVQALQSDYLPLSAVPDVIIHKFMAHSLLLLKLPPGRATTRILT